MNEIIIRLLPMPVGVRAFTIPDSEGDYNVYLNCRLSAEQQRRSLRHEQMHIHRNDFYNETSACAIERTLAALL
ncbi:MAG: hypothetical protein E7523_12755 [Ruminococcaceae bacterium]|nr:hypothetical protein [Oscillospiraceae bacterium]